MGGPGPRDVQNMAAVFTVCLTYLVDRESDKDGEKSPKIQTKDFPRSLQEAGAGRGWGLGVSGTQLLGKWF